MDHVEPDVLISVPRATESSLPRNIYPLLGQPTTTGMNHDSARERSPWSNSRWQAMKTHG